MNSLLALTEIPWALSIIAGLLGLAVGSFFNALEYRWSREESIVGSGGRDAKTEGADDDEAKSALVAATAARSRCPHCSKQLAWFDLVPVFSFIGLHGKCRSCGVAISWQYPVVELAAALVAALPFIITELCASKLCVSPNETNAAFMAFFGLALLFIFLYDHKHQIILDRVTLPLIVLAVPTGLLIFSHSLSSVFFGMLLGGGVFAFQYVVSRGAWVGGGDIRLGVLMGALLGFPVTIVALLLAYILGAGVGVYLIATGKAKKNTQIAFGTFLAVSTYVCMMYGGYLLNWYLGMLGL